MRLPARAQALKFEGISAFDAEVSEAHSSERTMLVGGDSKGPLTRTRARLVARTHACTHADSHTDTHAHTHARTRTHAHTHP